MELGNQELRLQAVDPTASRAQRIFEEVFRRGLPKDGPQRTVPGEHPVLSAEAPGLLAHVKELEETLRREGNDPSHVVQMRVNLLFARGFAARLKEQPRETRDHYLLETLPVLWWIDWRFGYNPFEYLDEALDETELDDFWRTSLVALTALAHDIDPPRARSPEEMLRAIRNTAARDLSSDAGDWPLLARGLYRFLQQPDERFAYVESFVDRCRSPVALSYVASLDAMRGSPEMLARLLTRGAPQAAMVALVAHARAASEVSVRRLVRRHIALADPPVASDRLASLYAWLEPLGNPDPELASLVLQLAAQRLQDEVSERSVPSTRALARAGESAYHPEALYAALARQIDGPARQLASARILERAELRLRGGALSDGALDSGWCGRYARAVRDACAPGGRTDENVVPLVMRAVHRASDSLTRNSSPHSIAMPLVAVDRARAFVELLVLLARRLPDDDVGRTLARTLLGTALGTIQDRPHLERDMPALMPLQHLTDVEGPPPRVRDAFSLVCARAFLERWRTVERGEADLSRSPKLEVVETVAPLVPDRDDEDVDDGAPVTFYDESLLHPPDPWLVRAGQWLRRVAKRLRRKPRAVKADKPLDDLALAPGPGRKRARERALAQLVAENDADGR